MNQDPVIITNKEKIKGHHPPELLHYPTGKKVEIHVLGAPYSQSGLPSVPYLMICKTIVDLPDDIAVITVKVKNDVSETDI